MADYVLESNTVSGTYLADIEFRDLQGENRYNEPDEIRWTMSLESLNKLTLNEIEPGRTEVTLWRNGIKVFVGPLWAIHVSSSEQTAKCMAQDPSSYWDKREVTNPLAYKGVATSYSSMAWNLINDAQSGGWPNTFYITRGNAPSTPALTGIEYDINETLYDAHDDLATAEDGFDWNVDVNRVYHQFYPRVSSQANIALEYGGNVRSYSLAYDGKFMSNSVRTLGKDELVSDLGVDTASRSTYGLRQSFESAKSIESLSMVNRINASYLKRRRLPRTTTQVSVMTEFVNPFEGNISYGQLVTTVIEDGWVSINQQQRCKGFQFFIDHHGNETFSLYLDDMREVT